MTIQLNARVGEVTNRIVERSRRSREAYLARIDSAVANGPARKRLGFQVFIFLIIFAGLMYFTKKKVWADSH